MPCWRHSAALRSPSYAIPQSREPRGRNVTLKEDALAYHASGRPGKVKVVPTKPTVTADDLSLAYTPGVAAPCLEIAREPEAAYTYTAKGNLVAVISNGTAVLGLGNIGALAGKPVMEGKGVLFKRFADIDVFDIEIDSTDPDEIVRTVKAISVGFGAIQLEDISAPRCFWIEERLQEELSIPVFHDDQHGTAVVVLAALLNALRVVGKDISQIRAVQTGAGAAGVASARMLSAAGLSDLIVYDTRGPISRSRKDLGDNAAKTWLAEETNPRGFDGQIKDALDGADFYLGLSGPGALHATDLARMNTDAIVGRH